MSLKDWQASGWLIPHQPSRQEITDLLAVVDRDVADADTAGLSPDWRLNIAYNAALQAATAALAASGYRASREAHHHRVLQSLQFTIGADLALVSQFDQFRKKRNQSGYDRAGIISDLEAAEMLDFARQLRDSVFQWLQDHHAALLP